MAIANGENDMDKNEVLKILETAKDENGEVPMRLVRQAFEKLPEPCGDTIYRQAAIDAAKDWYEGLICGSFRGLEKRLKSLPSAQPQRTCVNCGRTVNNGGWYSDGRTRCPIEEHYALPKDGYCHLWEKRNVSDDDYPERRDE